MLLSDLPWMHFADQNPAAFWFLVLTWGALAIAGVIAIVERFDR